MAGEKKLRPTIAERLQQAKEERAYIVEAAKDKKFLMLGETHVDPRMNTFIAQILSDLNPHGFTQLALELLPEDISVVRKCINKEISFHACRIATRTSNPYIDIIREADRLDYSAFGFNVPGRGHGREIQLYANVIRPKKKGTKMVVVCGSDHAMLQDYSPTADPAFRYERLGSMLVRRAPTYRVNLDTTFSKRAPADQVDRDASYLFRI